MRYTFSVASLRWHYPDQVQGFFSPGKCGTHLPRTPSFVLLQQVNQTTTRSLCHKTAMSIDPCQIFTSDMNELLQLNNSFMSVLKNGRHTVSQKLFYIEMLALGYFTVAMCNRLVVPDSPNGKPAEIAMYSPFLAKPSRTAAVTASLTISSTECTSLPTIE